MTIFSRRARGSRCAISECAEPGRCRDEGQDADGATRRNRGKFDYAEEFEEFAQQVVNDPQK